MADLSPNDLENVMGTRISNATDSNGMATFDSLGIVDAKPNTCHRIAFFLAIDPALSLVYAFRFSKSA